MDKAKMKGPISFFQKMGLVAHGFPDQAWVILDWKRGYN